jgi:muramoyltetrapeptide carboxypeptidase LdcA involved in peptidoglycan recycling
VFSSIKGLIIGRPYGYGEKEYKNLKQIIQYYTEPYNYPILCNVNIGHASPIITVPLGTNVLLDSDENKFVIIESGVE